MAVVSLRPVFRVPFFHLPPNPKRSDTFFNPHSKLSPISISSHSYTARKPPTFRTLATQSDCNAPRINPFCFLLPILQSFGQFVVSWLPKLRCCLRGGRDDAGEGEGGGRGAQPEDYVCCGGIGMMLMSTTAAMATKDRLRPFLWTLAGNSTFMSGLMAWALAQTLKMLLNFFVERRWDFGMLFSSGGMPSSHSALCMALTASVALCHGVGDSLFPVCLGFSLIVMYDAIGVRRHAGIQAKVLNKIIEDLFQGHPISERKLKELLGHTPSQVIAGAVLGILVACICCQGSVVAI